MKKEGTIIYKEMSIKYTFYKRSKKNIIFRVEEDGRVSISIPKSLSYKRGMDLFKENIDSVYPIIVSKIKKVEDSRGYIQILGRKRRYLPLYSKKNRYILLYEIIYATLDRYFHSFKSFPLDIRVRPLKRAWGICYSSKKITINDKLIEKDRKVIEYVIIHEICHLIHMNHSREFWDEVVSILPDAVSLRKELRGVSSKR